jgi:uncharacterized protein (DUF885 family)
MDRRQFLATSGAAALVVSTDSVAAPLGRGAGGDARLNLLFDRIFADQIAHSPTNATALGLDKGPNARLKSMLETRPYQLARAQDMARRTGYLRQLNAVPSAGLSAAAKLNREIVLYDIATDTVAPRRFGINSAISPYIWSQQDGAYFSIPDFLANTHTIATRGDAEAYLARLDQFATVMDNESAEQRRQAARGYVAPGWSLDLVLKQMTTLRDEPAATSGLVTSLTTRAAKAGIAGEWQRRAEAIVTSRVYPALDRQMALVQQLRSTTPAGDGAWRLPHGDEIYAVALAQATTTDLTPEQVHVLGLQQVAEISGQLDAILKAAGYTNGSVGERLTALNASAAQQYSNDDAGRAALIASLNAGFADMMTRLPRAFATVPHRSLEIRRVPPNIQEGAANGYYQPATIDGSRSAIYYINLKSTSDWPKYQLPALTYHEGVPGHHLQGGIAQTSGALPMIRRNAYYSGYGEGWALYAEQLADELGGYNGIERAGYLQSYLFRAARLVVDTGLNSKRWSREKAIDYMVATTGFARPRVQREVERYCASVGQACSYKIGHLAWTRARAEAQATLGAKFDLKQFHEVLKEGAMPLTILQRRIRERTQAQLRG